MLRSFFSLFFSLFLFFSFTSAQADDLLGDQIAKFGSKKVTDAALDTLVYSVKYQSGDSSVYGNISTLDVYFLRTLGLESSQDWTNYSRSAKFFSDPENLLALCDLFCGNFKKKLQKKRFLKIRIKRMFEEGKELFKVSKEKGFEVAIKAFLKWEKEKEKDKKMPHSIAGRWEKFFSTHKDMVKPKTKTPESALFAYRYFMKQPKKWKEVFTKLSTVLK